MHHLIGGACKLSQSLGRCVTDRAALKAPLFDLVRRLNKSLWEA